jgi:hypothetical protein
LFIVYDIPDENYFVKQSHPLNIEEEDVEEMVNNPILHQPQLQSEASEKSNLTTDEDWINIFERANACLPRLPSFNIMSEGEKVLQDYENQKREFQERKKDRLCSNPNHNCSKTEFCMDLSTLNAPYRVPQNYQNKLIKFMDEHLRTHDIDVPFAEVKYSNSEKVRGYKSTIDDYIPPTQGC